MSLISSIKNSCSLESLAPLPALAGVTCVVLVIINVVNDINNTIFQPPFVAGSYL